VVPGLRILFIHRNFPGQFRHLATALKQRGHDVLALTDVVNKQAATVQVTHYTLPTNAGAGGVPPLATTFVENITRGEAAAAAMVRLKADGFVPDLIIGACGWGETLFCRDVFPGARLILHAEYYYGDQGADVAFGREYRGGDLGRAFRLRSRNASMLLAMVDADALVAPTRWQAARFPEVLRPKLHVAHEGIDTAFAVPDAAATLKLGRQDLTIRAGEEIVTFVNRNLEPIRGFHAFMRSLPHLMAARPNARAVIVGGDGVSYGAAPAGGKTWKSVLLAEVGDRLPMERIHFVGRVPHRALINLFQVSAAHVYLSYPFVLSWSMLEAMSAGALVVGSRTPSIEEVIADGRNGLLVDFHDPMDLAATLIGVLERPEGTASLRRAARDTILERYDLQSRCLPKWLDIIDRVAGGGARPVLH
jgi:glycosyltransferase involved in cell wall biosynthesis